MPDQKTLKFWIDPLGTTASVSTSASGTLTLIDPGTIVPLGDDEFKQLLNESNEANETFAKAKDEFRKEHGVEWDPKIKFTFPAALEHSKELIGLRDRAARLIARVLATPRK